jgi:hypothetical protein
MGESVATDSDFKVYFSGRIKGSYALVIVAHCSGVDGPDFLEYHVCVSSVCGSSASGKVDREELFESEPGAERTSLSLAEFGKVAAEIALWGFLLERRSVTKDQSWDLAGFWLEEGTPADLLTIKLQGTFDQFLADTQTRTSRPRLREFLRRIAGMSKSSRPSAV